MAAVVLAAPILPGKQEPWRRFTQEVLESRCSEYQESRLRLGITRELVWYVQTSQGEMAIMYLETESQEAGQVVANMAASSLPFDRWFRQQLVELHNLDVTQGSPKSTCELVFEWYVA